MIFMMTVTGCIYSHESRVYLLILTCSYMLKFMDHYHRSEEAGRQ